MTTLKHGMFVNEPMGGKGVLNIPGVGPVGRTNFLNGGIVHPHQVLGQFMLMRDQNAFINWLQPYIPYSNHREQCAHAMNVYYHNYVL